MTPALTERPGAVALVTGAAQGIGAAVTEALLVQGVHVAALDRKPLPQAPAPAAAPGVRRGRSLSLQVDVSDRAAVERAVATAEAELGPIGRLVNAAGVLAMGPALAWDDAGFDACMDVNVGGMRHVSLAVASRMRARGGGAIVTVASNAAHTPRHHMSSYCASKAAAVAFTKVLGLELAEHGVRCNVVSPGSTDTPMQRALWQDEHGARATVQGSPATYKLGIPLGRIADAEDVAAAVLFLLSDRARHITMHELCVDGGATLGR